MRVPTARLLAAVGAGLAGLTAACADAPTGPAPAGGPALAQLWLFILATLLGGALAGLLYPLVFGRHGEPVAGSGLRFGRRPPPGAVPGYGAPDAYQQQWNQPGGSTPFGGSPDTGGYQQPAAPSYAAPAAATPAPAPAEQPIIQDGWQWDPQAQQWIPVQQQPPQQGGWQAPGGEQTQVRPTDGV